MVGPVGVGRDLVARMHRVAAGVAVAIGVVAVCRAAGRGDLAGAVVAVRSGRGRAVLGVGFGGQPVAAVERVDELVDGGAGMVGAQHAGNLPGAVVAVDALGDQGGAT